jgi:phage tail sheath protein FI
MPVTPTYPGVYVLEIPSGVRTITGVGTSIAVFIGAAKLGPMFRPVLCTSYLDFVRAFSEDTSLGEMPLYVRLFFLNGGTQCWVMRIANNAQASSVILQNEAGVNTLELTAKNMGLAGENIRAVVTYSGPQPESTFNIDLFRWEVENGVRVQKDAESWKGLNMDALSPSYAPSFLGQNSKLVDAADLNAPRGTGFSQSGRPVPFDGTGADFQTQWGALLGTAATRNRFLISVDRSPYVEVNLDVIDVAAMPAGSIEATDLPQAIQQRIEGAFNGAGINGITVGVSFVAGPNTAAGDATRFLRIVSTAATPGDVYIRPANTADLAASLMLGTEQGGLEISVHAPRRPAANGLSLDTADPAFAALNQIGALVQSDINQITLERPASPGPGFVTESVAVDLVTTAAGDNMFVNAGTGAAHGQNDGIREKLAILAAAVNQRRQSNPLFPWFAAVAGNRLTLTPGAAFEDNYLAPLPVTATTDIGAQFNQNVKYYTLGAGGLGIGQQVAGATGSDGTAPIAADYETAFSILDSEVDLFTLMVLPPNAGAPAPVQSLYGNASVFCRQRRAFLIMDPPETWSTAQDAINAATGVNSLRIGLVKDYAALYFPRVTVNDGGTVKNIGPAGAIAGLMARIDSTRGVWKAPAGTEADLRGVIGLQHKFSDGENGVLNPRAVNTLRIFPNGIVSWGARTMDGDDDFGSEYKYVPIRRLALFIEESLYRGLKWVVFEPNDEPLWSQIRLNVGAFMHDLFRKGAFQGATPRDAYFVKCDASTTTQTDRNNGIVNIFVGFAPLKPAEFVIIHLQQMAGQIEV